MTLKTVLFVAYGSGHIKMLIPVAQALAASGRARPVVLALTTAAPSARAAGLAVVQFKDFVTPGDAPALAHGRRLMASLGAPVADAEETIAYLGLSFADLVADLGPALAESRYAQKGRQAFLPIATLARILKKIRPDVVVATNSPRAERAAIVAAGQMGIASVCVVDLFAIDEVQWIGEAGYADRVCVLNESVRQFLVHAGRRAEQIVVTGNPGFDGLFEKDMPARALALRKRMGWGGKRVILWPSVIEPAVHPFKGRTGNPALPASVLNALIRWVTARTDCVLCVRPRAGEQAIAGVTLPSSAGEDAQVVMTGQDWALAPLLHAADLVVTINSTVGLEGRLVGARVVQVLGSVLDDALPLAAYGLADESVTADGLDGALERQIALPRHPVLQQSPATLAVCGVVAAYL